MRFRDSSIVPNAFRIVLRLVISNARDDIVLAYGSCVLHLKTMVFFLVPAGRLRRFAARFFEPFLHLCRIAARERREMIADPLLELLFRCTCRELCAIVLSKIVAFLIAPDILIAVGVTVVLMIEPNEALHTIVLVERPLQLPIVVPKAAERIVHLAIKCVEVRIAGVARIAGKRAGTHLPVLGLIPPLSALLASS